MENTQKELLKV